MGLHNMLDPEEKEKRSRHLMFDVFSPITTKQVEATVSLNQILNVPIKLDYVQIKRLQQNDT